MFVVLESQLIVILFVASPIHGIKQPADDRRDVDIPIETMATLVPGLEKLVAEGMITVEHANQIILTKTLPVELAHYFGLLPQNAPNGFDSLASRGGPVAFTRGYSNSSGFNSPNHPCHLSGSASPNPLVGNSFSATGSACPSPIYNYSGTSSPNPYVNAMAASPLHQITKGISGLTTGGGSITRGTSAAFDCGSNMSNEPLDLTMEASVGTDTAAATNAGNWFVPAQFYDLKPLNLSPAQQVRVVPTPPASPNLCIIQEENSNVTTPLYGDKSVGSITLGTVHALNAMSTTATNTDDIAGAYCHPQISVTDVQGSEITLVALSDNSRDSEDSLDAHNSMTMHGLLITEPSSDMPSITRGVGRKFSLEIEQRQDAYERRGSDKSLGFSDDSLSNDSNILSPGHEPSASSGFKSGDSHSEMTEARLSPDSLSDSRRMSEECYELPLPHECYHLDSSRIIEIVKQTIDSKMPPKCFVVHKSDQDGGMLLAGGVSSGSNVFAGGSSADVPPFALDISNLSLEYSGGLQIEVQVCGGGSKDNCNKGIKLRRISGDQFEYGKLCQQLISSLTVWLLEK